MDNLLPEFQKYKDKIPEFIIKLYHILEQKEYSDYLTWNGNSEILIKQPKKLAQKVLPRFFRHRNLQSFIRQLNMYRFSKVVKLLKERNFMYFKNPHFKRGEIKELLKITRNIKNSRRQNLEMEQQSDGAKSQNISIDDELKKNDDLSNYKMFVHKTVQQIANTLKLLQGSHPEIKQELKISLTKCNELLQVQSQQRNQSFMNLPSSDLLIHNLNTQKMLSGIEIPILFPSHSHFNF